MFLPTSADFFLPSYTSSLKVSEQKEFEINEDFTNGSSLTHLVLKNILRFMSLNDRLQLIQHTHSNELKRTNATTPYKLETCAIGANVIELDFFASSWTFTGNNKVLKRYSGGLRKEYDLEISQDEAMLQILRGYLNRRGTSIKKLFLKDSKAVNFLRALGFHEKFEISNGKGQKLDEFFEKLADMEAPELAKMEWTLVDKRKQHH